VFGGILHRMILWELTKVFLISLVGITGILLMAGIVAEASQQGLGPGQILAAIPLLIPSTLPYTIPATTLFAVCVVYGRLASDNEILAIKASGIHLSRVVMPALLLGIVMSGVTMALYYRIIPYAHYLLRAMIFHDAEELLYSILKKQGVISHSQMPYSMWVKGVQGRKLLYPTFKRRDAQGQTDIVAMAREADLRVNIAKRVLLIQMRFGVASSEDGSQAYFEDRIWEVPLPGNFGADSQRRARDMTWQEILASRREIRVHQEEARAELALKTSLMIAEDAPPDLPKHVKNLQDRLKYYDTQMLFLNVELLMRPALSLGCLCFIVVGCPVGIWFGKSDYLSSFITCFLPIVILYYPLMLCGTGFAKEGRINPVLLVWGADLLLGAVGVALFWKLLRS
jgi:lipopolysaccharide export system permease protein